MEWLNRMTILDALIYNTLGLELIINDGKVIGLMAAEEMPEQLKEKNNDR